MLCGLAVNAFVSAMGITLIQGKASMLQDLEKGRKCEIRFIDGVVSDEGKKLGILTPYTDAVVTIVSEIEEKKRPLQNNLDAMPDLPIV